MVTVLLAISHCLRLLPGISCFVTIVSAAAIFDAASAAKFDWQREGRGGPASVFIEGRIVSGDDDRFRKLLVRLIREGVPVTTAYIYSQGGSVSAALDIGRQIRTLGMGTSAPVRLTGLGANAATCVRRTHTRDGRKLASSQQTHWTHGYSDRPTHIRDQRCICTSACFLIWVAGTRRFGDWIGIHRPFFDPAEYQNLSASEAKQRYRQVVSSVNGYLQEMDIPEYIIRKMMGHSSEDMYFLSAGEVKSLTNDAAIDELKIAKCGGWNKWTQRWQSASSRGDRVEMQRLLDQQKKMTSCRENINIEIFKDRVDRYLRIYAN
jgi:hypothetical protein